MLLERALAGQALGGDAMMQYAGRPEFWRWVWVMMKRKCQVWIWIGAALVLLLFLVGRRRGREGEEVNQVAVCLSGSLGSFGAEEVYKTVHENVLAALKVDYDLFFHLELASAEGKRQDGVYYRPSPASDLEQLMTAFEPVVAQQHNPDVHDASSSKCSWNLSQEDVQDWAKASACYELVEEREKSLGRSYDWIVHLRPDIAWLEPLPEMSAFDSQVITVTSHGPRNDPWVRTDFAVVPRSYGDAYFKTVEEQDICQYDGRDPLLTSAESGIRTGPMLLGDRLQRLHVPYAQGPRQGPEVDIMSRLSEDYQCGSTLSRTDHMWITTVRVHSDGARCGDLLQDPTANRVEAYEHCTAAFGEGAVPPTDMTLVEMLDVPDICSKRSLRFWFILAVATMFTIIIGALAYRLRDKLNSQAKPHSRGGAKRV